jgi:DNA-binding CsgD family transcriptional regulator
MRARGRPRHPGILTARQYEVWQLLRQGLTNDEIAERLRLSHDGVKYHVADILRRLGVANRHEAAAWQPNTERRGWLEALAPAGLLKRVNAATPAYLVASVVVIVALGFIALLAWGVAANALGDSGTAGEARIVLGSDVEDLGELVFSVDGDLWTVNKDGSGLAAVVPPEDVTGSLSSPEFSHDGSQLAFIDDRRRIAVATLASGNVDVIDLFVDRTPPMPTASDTSMGPIAVHWSPDDEWLLVTRQRLGGSGFTDVIIMRPDGSDQRTIVDEAAAPPYFIEATWSESRAPGTNPFRIVIVAGDDGMTGVAYDLDGNVVGDAYAPAIRSGFAVYQSPTTESVAVAPAKGSPEPLGPILIGDITGERRIVASGCGVAWSPDGGEIVFYDGTGLKRIETSAASPEDAILVVDNRKLRIGDQLERRADLCDEFGVTWRN